MGEEFLDITHFMKIQGQTKSSIVEEMSRDSNFPIQLLIMGSIWNWRIKLRMEFLGLPYCHDPLNVNNT